MSRLPKVSFLGDRRATKATMGVSMVVALLASAVAIIGSIAPSRSPDRLSTLAVRSPRVVVVKSKRLLHLFDGQDLIRTYPMDLGTAPVGQKLRANDGRTPIGQFRIVYKNPESRYHLFLGLDYPNAEAVETGLKQGLISLGEAASVLQAVQTGQCPDWRTALGGGIGIHGHRIGRDWTGGCIAVSDEHVAELYAVLRIGDPVEILP